MHASLEQTNRSRKNYVILQCTANLVLPYLHFGETTTSQSFVEYDEPDGKYYF